MARCNLVVGVNKQSNEVGLTGFLLGAGLFHRLGVGDVSLVVGKVVYHVGDRNLKNNVHSAFQVKAKPDLGLKTFLIGVDAEILNRVLVILLGHWVLQFCCLGVIVAGRYREREVENAGKSQQDGRKNYDSFVLHCFYNYLNCSRDNVVQR